MGFKKGLEEPGPNICFPKLVYLELKDSGEAQGKQEEGLEVRSSDLQGEPWSLQSPGRVRLWSAPKTLELNHRKPMSDPETQGLVPLRPRPL